MVYTEICVTIFDTSMALSGNYCKNPGRETETQKIGTLVNK